MMEGTNLISPAGDAMKIIFCKSGYTLAEGEISTNSMCRVEEYLHIRACYPKLVTIFKGY